MLVGDCIISQKISQVFENSRLFWYDISMTTITIPKRVTKGAKLVIIPRQEYERFLRFQKSDKIDSRDEALEEGLADARAGRVTPVFSSVKAFKRFLKK